VAVSEPNAGTEPIPGTFSRVFFNVWVTRRLGNAKQPNNPSLQPTTQAPGPPWPWRYFFREEPAGGVVIEGDDL
jgi:hypothetical protein